jgi:hypothetical protein
LGPRVLPGAAGRDGRSRDAGLSRRPQPAQPPRDLRLIATPHGKHTYRLRPSKGRIEPHGKCAYCRPAQAEPGASQRARPPSILSLLCSTGSASLNLLRRQSASRGAPPAWLELVLGHARRAEARLLGHARRARPSVCGSRQHASPQEPEREGIGGGRISCMVLLTWVPAAIREPQEPNTNRVHESRAIEPRHRVDDAHELRQRLMRSRA